MKPEDAVAYAARIIQDQLSIFVNFEEPRKETIEEKVPEPRREENWEGRHFLHRWRFATLSGVNLGFYRDGRVEEMGP